MNFNHTHMVIILFKFITVLQTSVCYHINKKILASFLPVKFKFELQEISVKERRSYLCGC